MFDGAGVATLTTVVTDLSGEQPPAPDDVTTENAPSDAAPTGEPQFSSSDQALFDALAANDVSQARQEIVFLSPSVRDYQQLLDGISPNVEVHVLDSTRDGVAQMAEVLAGRTGIDAIHLIGEGTEAQMHLGSSFLTQESISTQYAALFQQIGQSLSANADLLVYGCNFGQGDAGQVAIETLAQLTGADVTASTDRTGSTAEFGDWQLEMATGAIETAVVISADTQATWDHALATFTVTNTNNSGAGSFRQAILDANANSGTDTIAFNIALNDANHLYYRDNAGAGFSAPVTTTLADVAITDFDADYLSGTARSWYRISLTGSSLDVTQAVIIDGSTQPGYDSSKGPIIEIDAFGITSPSGDLNAIALTTGASTIRGLVINGAGDNAIEVDTGAGSSVIVGNYFGTDVSGTVADGNARIGTGGPWGAIAVKSNNVVIGGTTAADRNVISGNNGYGIEIYSSASNTTITGNYIGTAANGTGSLGNAAAGITIRNSAGIATIGGTTASAANVIAFNSGDGVWLQSDAGSGTSVLRNTIYSNNELGIDLGTNGVTFNDLEDGDSGANNLLNFPVITNVVQNGANLDVTFSVDLPTGWYRIEFYENAAGADPSGFGEGRTFLGAATINVTSNLAGYTSFTRTLTNVTPSAIVGISATATQDTSGGAGTTFGSTSEFGPSFLGAGVLVVDTTSNTADAAGFGTATFNIASLLANRGADGVISLREAIDATNRTANIGGQPDQIRFNISGAGPHVINIGSALPTISEAVIIDGTTEPDYSTTPVVRIDGAAAGFSGISIGGTGGGTTIRGLMITGFTVDGINVASGADNVTIADNWIGTAGTGTSGHGNANVGNSDDGIDIAASNAIVTNNVITNNNDEGITIVGSGVTGHLIQGNYIGLDPDGSTSVNGNNDVGLAIISGTGNTIGGTTVAARNVISRNNEGMEINTSNNVVQGNYIGTDASGTANKGNRIGDGVQIQGGSTGNLIGGIAPNAGNLIAFNFLNGVNVASGTGNAVLGNTIHSNTQLGINLGTAGVTNNDTNDGDTGANDLLNFPIVTKVVQNGANLDITLVLDVPAGTYRIEFFENPSGIDSSRHGEGQVFLGALSVTSTGTGAQTFTGTLNSVTATAITRISATATRDLGGGTYSDTSEFGPRAGLVVSTTNDTMDGTTTSVAALIANPGADGHISLREAITAANASSGTDYIYFDITAALVGGVHTITLTYDGPDAGTTPDALPIITSPVVINGWTEPDYAGSPIIELNGNNVGTLVQGLMLSAGSDGSTIKGMIINRFTGTGLEIQNSNNHVIQGSWFGLNAAGTAASANAVKGIYALNATGLLIGTDADGNNDAGERNVVSGNTEQGIFFDNVDNSTIAGNYVGTNAAGTADVNGSTANTAQSGVFLTSGSSGNVVGGTVAAARNILSGNNHFGFEVLFGSQNNLLQGNYIGTDVTGLIVLGNINGGATFWNAGTGNVFGGSSVAARNVIAGNTFSGIVVGNASTGATIQGNYIGVGADGTTVLGNGGPGISVEGGSTGTLIGSNNDGTNDVGESNLIVGNSIGVSVTGASTTGNAIQSNSIYGNAGLGIDLGTTGVTPNDGGDGDSGANNLQNSPVLFVASSTGGNTVITGSLNSTASTTFRIEFFSNPTGDASGQGEGQTYLGFTTVTTDASGFASFNTTLTGVAVATGYAVSATATVDLGGGSYGSTSEFAANLSANTSAAVGAGQDTYIQLQNPTFNYGTSPSLIIDREATDLQRALFQFDLSAIPSNATITSATLQMQATQIGGTLNISVYEMLRAWTEGTANGTANAANWNESASGTNWTSAGGDFNATAVANLNTNSTGQHSWNLTTLVQAWVDGTKTNNGVLVASPDGGGNRTATYDSSEGTTAPRLVISYTVPANTAPTITSNGGGNTASISVAETISAVTDVNATDPEAPPQALTYSLSGVDAGDFTIDANTGVLTFTSAPDFENPTDSDTNNVYQVTVQVADGNGGTDTQDLTITVTNVANTLTVTTASDADDTGLGASYTIEQLNALGGAVSLREAITAANSTAGTDTISFNIAGAGPHTINVLSALPTITQAVIIDGTTEPDFGTSPIIELNGSGAGAVNGLVLAAGSGGSTIRGLVIQNFNQSGILVQSANNVIAGNYIGLDSDGTTIARNNTSNTTSLGGIRLETSGNTIGGLTAADRNVISGNFYSGIVLFGSSANSNIIRGNYIGTDAGGTLDRGNDQEGIDIDGGSNNIIGGDSVAARNVISGNDSDGIEIDSGDNNIIQGNYIGTDYTGTLDVGNARDGIDINENAGDGATGNLIGGTGANEGNLIFGNDINGIEVRDNPTIGNQILGNQIFGNSALGIDLGPLAGVTGNDGGDGDSGPNNLVNFPVLYNVTITGGNVTISGEGRPGATVEFFESPSVAGANGQAQTFIGRNTIGLTGTAGTVDPTAIQFSFTFSIGSLVSGDRVTATATTVADGTSEFSVNVAANAAPVVAGVGGTLAYTEGDPATVIDGTLTVSDVDSATLTSATISITGGFVSGEDVLAFTNTGTITGSYNAGTGILTLTGTDTLANYEAALESITYENTNTSNPNTGARTVSWVVNDGTANSVAVTSTITVAAQNDPPDIVDATVALDENSANGTAVTNVNDSFTGTDLDRDGQALTYSITAGNTGGAFAINAATGAITVANSAALDFETTPSFTLTVQASDGTLTDTAAITVNLNNLNEAPVAGDDAAVTIENTAVTTGNVLANDSDVDSVLSPASITAFDAVTVNGGTVVNNGDGTFTYTPGANFTGIDTFTYTVSDGLLSDTATVTITVTPAGNSAPSLTANTGSTVTQGLTDVITASELQVIDLDNTPGQLVYSITAVPTNGHLELTTTPGVAITTFTQADLDAGRVIFVHSGAAATSDSFTFTVSDGAGGTIGATVFGFTVAPFIPPPGGGGSTGGGGGGGSTGGSGGTGTGSGSGSGTGSGAGGSGTVVPPVIQPPSVLISTEVPATSVPLAGASTDALPRIAMAERTFGRIEQPPVMIQELPTHQSEPLSLPVKRVLTVGHKLVERLTRLADELERGVEEKQSQTHLVGRVASFSGMALSAGFVAWILRGGSLVASFLVSMPAWRHFDPLPVLGMGESDRRRRDRRIREEAEQEKKQFRGLDQVLKSSQNTSTSKRNAA